MLRATARREAREEAGVEIERVRVVDSSVFALDDGRRVVNVVTTADYAGGEAHRAAPDEVAAVEWRTPAGIRGTEDAPDFSIGYLDVVEAARDG